MGRSYACRLLLCIIAVALATTGLAAQTPNKNVPTTGGAQASPYPPAMAQFLDTASAKIEQSLKSNDIESVNSLRVRMKDIGLSYDQSLPATPDARIIKGKSRDELAMLWGLYTADMTYALTFDKRIDAFFPVIRSLEDALGFRSASITEGLAVKDSTIQITRATAFWYDLLQKSKADSSLVQILVCGFYGSSLEAFYILAKLGISTGTSADYQELLVNYLDRLEITRDMLAAYGGTPTDRTHLEFVRVLDTAGKGKVIESLLKIMQDSKGKPKEADLRAIIAIIEKVRTPLLKIAR